MVLEACRISAISSGVGFDEGSSQPDGMSCLGGFETDNRNFDVLGYTMPVLECFVHFLCNDRSKKFLSALAANASWDVPKNEMLSTATIIPFYALFENQATTINAI